MRDIAAAAGSVVCGSLFGASRTTAQQRPRDLDGGGGMQWPQCTLRHGIRVETCSQEQLDAVPRLC
jgi:hypothetical protein